MGCDNGKKTRITKKQSIMRKGIINIFQPVMYSNISMGMTNKQVTAATT